MEIKLVYSNGIYCRKKKIVLFLFSLLTASLLLVSGNKTVGLFKGVVGDNWLLNR
jgi:hypothetical protein